MYLIATINAIKFTVLTYVKLPKVSLLPAPCSLLPTPLSAIPD
ncbi:hypothetical protein [Moorena producens]|nr:hypothetical protein [Moorena producens]